MELKQPLNHMFMSDNKIRNNTCLIFELSITLCDIGCTIMGSDMHEGQYSQKATWHISVKSLL